MIFIQCRPRPVTAARILRLLHSRPMDAMDLQAHLGYPYRLIQEKLAVLVQAKKIRRGDFGRYEVVVAAPAALEA